MKNTGARFEVSAFGKDFPGHGYGKVELPFRDFKECWVSYIIGILCVLLLASPSPLFPPCELIKNHVVTDWKKGKQQIGGQIIRAVHTIASIRRKWFTD